MCKPASFIISRHKVWWHPTSDAHQDIISKYSIHIDGPRGVNATPVGISPDNDDLSRPLSEWTFRIDIGGYMRDLPDWWDAEREEARCRAALEDWATAKLSGWRLHEAFHPVHPFKIQPAQMAPERVQSLVKQWVSVRASIGESIGASVRRSIGESIGASVGAYIGSLFPNITEWRYVTDDPHPWDSLRELWLSGRVMRLHGKVWRVHVGPDARVESAKHGWRTHRRKTPDMRLTPLLAALGWR